MTSRTPAHLAAAKEHALEHARTGMSEFELVDAIRRAYGISHTDAVLTMEQLIRDGAIAVTDYRVDVPGQPIEEEYERAAATTAKADLHVPTGNVPWGAFEVAKEHAVGYARTGWSVFRFVDALRLAFGLQHLPANLILDHLTSTGAITVKGSIITGPGAPPPAITAALAEQLSHAERGRAADIVATLELLGWEFRYKGIRVSGAVQS